MWEKRHKEIIMYSSLEKIEKIKREMFNKIQEIYWNSIEFDVFDKIEMHRTYPNCIDCKNFNFGRRFWICLKDHSIHQKYGGRDLIPFVKTAALKDDCKDYEERDRHEFEEARIVGIKKFKDKVKDYVKKRRKKM